MKRPQIILTSLGLALGLGAAFWIYNSATPAGAGVVINGTTVPPIPVLHAERVIQGKALYARYCAECHGANLEGQPNWRQRLPDGSLPAPPHDNSGHTWHHSDEVLLYIVADGGLAFSADSKMPAYKDTLTQEERAAVLDFIKSTWGRQEREYQWWMTATRTDAGTIRQP